MSSSLSIPQVRSAARELRDTRLQGVPAEWSESGRTLKHLAWMLDRLCDREDTPFEESAANRWLGYVQAGLVWEGLLSVDDARENVTKAYHVVVTNIR